MDLKSANILVTGGRGFLGIHVTRELRKIWDCNFVIPDSYTHDLRNKYNVRDILNAERYDLIIHLAASVGGIGANKNSPGSFFYDNMIMGLNILEEARIANVPKVVIAGTVCAYPKITPIPFKEESLWDGYPEETNAPYGIAKKSLLVMAQAYRQQYGSNYVMLFPVNLYGPFDNFNLETSHVIPAMIRKFHQAKINKEKSVVLWGDGSPTREFLYVEDAARAFVLASERYDQSDPVNVGSGFEISMKDLADKISGIIGYTGDIIWDTTMPNGQPRRKLNITKAKEYFGFEAQVNFDIGLEKTINWYLENCRTEGDV